MSARPGTLAMLAHFGLISLMGVGGINAVIPEMHRYLVEAHGFLGESEFASLYALSQAAPGPNGLAVTLFGLEIAGPWLAIALTLAMFLPSFVLAYQAGAWIERFAHTRWMRAFRRGMAPITLGLVLSSGYILARAGATDWLSVGLTGVTIVLLLTTRWNPLWLIVAGAALGLLK